MCTLIGIFTSFLSKKLWFFEDRDALSRGGALKFISHFLDKLLTYVHLFLSRPQLIFSGEYVKAMNESFHSGHFCCQKCDTSLSGQSYILKDEKPHCVACYDNEFANRCEECGKTIGHDSKVCRLPSRRSESAHREFMSRRTRYVWKMQGAVLVSNGIERSNGFGRI